MLSARQVNIAGGPSPPPEAMAAVTLKSLWMPSLKHRVSVGQSSQGGWMVRRLLQK